jgi:hypothetical protein
MTNGPVVVGALLAHHQLSAPWPRRGTMHDSVGPHFGSSALGVPPLSGASYGDPDVVRVAAHEIVAPASAELAATHRPREWLAVEGHPSNVLVNESKQGSSLFSVPE